MIDFKNDVEWSKVFGVIDSVETLKRNQTLPLRTEIVEMAIDKYSNGKLKYVGDTADGMDFEGSDGLRYECKMQGKIFQPKTLWSNKVILRNHRGKDLGPPGKTFDKVIFIDTGKRRVGVVNFEDLEMFPTDANVKCRVADQSTFDVVADDVSSDKRYEGVNMEKIIFEAIQKNLK